MKRHPACVLFVLLLAPGSVFARYARPSPQTGALSPGGATAVLPGAVRLSDPPGAALLPQPGGLPTLAGLEGLAGGWASGPAFDGGRLRGGAIVAVRAASPLPALAPSHAPRPGEIGPSGPVPASLLPASFAPEDIPGATPLQKHVAFFDEDGDGVITVWETRRRLMRLGFGAGRATVIAAAIHLALGPKTGGSLGEKLRLEIRVDNIPAGMHAGDSGVYDAQGRFVPAEFERMFAEFSRSRPGWLNEAEVRAMIAANAARRPGFLAEAAARAEFGLLLEIAADGEDSVEGRKVRAISRQRLMEFYDGTLFYKLVR